jgi:hydrogenase large subunit
MNGLAAGHGPMTKYATAALDTVSSLAKTKVGLDAMHSTIGRHAARAISCCVNVDLLSDQWTALVTNISKGDVTTYNKPVFPKDEVMGVGFHEAPRGALSHWVVIDNGKIKNYQCVVPSTWNACPRNEHDEPGPYESSLKDTPIADAERPLEVLRTIHSFDPCIACAIHLTDQENDAAYTVRAS